MSKDSRQSVNSADQIRYVFMTLKELTCITWEYIRKHKLSKVSNTSVEKYDENVENN